MKKVIRFKHLFENQRSTALEIQQLLNDHHDLESSLSVKNGATVVSFDKSFIDFNIAVVSSNAFTVGVDNGDSSPASSISEVMTIVQNILKYSTWAVSKYFFNPGKYGDPGMASFNNMLTAALKEFPEPIQEYLTRKGLGPSGVTIFDFSNEFLESFEEAVTYNELTEISLSEYYQKIANLGKAFSELYKRLSAVEKSSSYRKLNNTDWNDKDEFSKVLTTSFKMPSVVLKFDGLTTDISYSISAIQTMPFISFDAQRGSNVNLRASKLDDSFSAHHLLLAWNEVTAQQGYFALFTSFKSSKLTNLPIKTEPN